MKLLQGDAAEFQRLRNFLKVGVQSNESLLEDSSGKIRFASEIKFASSMDFGSWIHFGSQIQFESEIHFVTKNVFGSHFESEL